MKEKELREIAQCALCRKPFGHSGLPLFWRVTVERHGVELSAVRRQDSFAQFLGSSHLASVMGDDRDMTRPMMKPITVTVCEICTMDPRYGFLLHQIAEMCEPVEIPE